MKTRLFNNDELTPKEILDNLQSENCGMEEGFEFVKPFTEDELNDYESDYLEKMKSLCNLEKELEKV